MEKQVQQLEINMAELKKDIQYLKVGQDRHDANLIEIKQDQVKIFDKIDELVTCLDSKYSLKWVENSFVRAIQIISGIVIAGLIGLISAAYLHLF
jgi:hypothetical protein